LVPISRLGNQFSPTNPVLYVLDRLTTPPLDLICSFSPPPSFRQHFRIPTPLASLHVRHYPYTRVDSSNGVCHDHSSPFVSQLSP
jgi:hypothetical protein